MQFRFHSSIFIFFIICRVLYCFDHLGYHCENGKLIIMMMPNNPKTNQLQPIFGKRPISAIERDLPVTLQNTKDALFCFTYACTFGFWIFCCLHERKKQQQLRFILISGVGTNYSISFFYIFTRYSSTFNNLIMLYLIYSIYYTILRQISNLSFNFSINSPCKTISICKKTYILVLTFRCVM